MNQLSGVRVLIVEADPETSWTLRSRLIGEGAKVHVVHSAKAALLIAERMPLHVAFVPFDQDEKLAALSRLFALTNVAQIFTASDAIPPEVVRRPSKRLEYVASPSL